MERNARIYPIYRMVSNDYLFYLAISFLFFTITKGLTVGQILYIDAFYGVFLTVSQLPLEYLVEKIGLKKSMIIGNICWVIHCLICIFASNITLFIIANLICAVGTNLKRLSESPLLYGSLKYINGRKNFTKIEGKGAALYYYFEATATLFVGYLFQINNYIPIVITLLFLIISTILSISFEDIKEYTSEKISFKKYVDGFKLVIKSRRLIAILLYTFIISGFMAVFSTIRKSIVNDMGTTPMEYSIIFAIMMFFVGIGSSSQVRIESKTKRKTLTVIGYSMIGVMILIGLLGILIKDKDVSLLLVLPILVIYGTFNGAYKISIKKYLNNFTTHEIRGKILSVYYIFDGLGTAILLFICGYVIDRVGDKLTAIAFGIVGFALMYFVLKYMQKYLGLDADRYKKEDIYNVDLGMDKKIIE